MQAQETDWLIFFPVYFSFVQQIVHHQNYLKYFSTSTTHKYTHKYTHKKNANFFSFPQCKKLVFFWKSLFYSEKISWKQLFPVIYVGSSIIWLGANILRCCNINTHTHTQLEGEPAHTHTYTAPTCPSWFSILLGSCISFQSFSSASS